MKKYKRESMKERELLNQARIRIFDDKENNKYVGIFEVDTIKQAEMNNKLWKTYIRRTRNILETRFYCINLIKGINTWVGPLYVTLKVD